MIKKEMKLLIWTAVILLSIQMVMAGTVTRSFNPVNPSPGSTVSVMLSVDFDKTEQTYYSMDEVYPAGWTASDLGGLDNTQAGHLKMVVFSSAVPIIYTYKLVVPTTATKGDFSGKFMFEGDAVETSILGATSLFVGPSTPTCTAVAATCSATGTACPENTITPKITCLSDQTCTAGKCVDNVNPPTCTPACAANELCTSSQCVKNEDCAFVPTGGQKYYMECGTGKPSRVSCGTCPSGKTCTAGKCVDNVNPPTCAPACAANEYCLNTTCVPVLNESCGIHGIACNQNSWCFANKDHPDGALCVCKEGFKSCTTGCQTNVKTDNSNCGGCGVVCTTGTTCQNGVCTPSGELTVTAIDVETKGLFERINTRLTELKEDYPTPSMLQRLTAIAKAIKG